MNATKEPSAIYTTSFFAVADLCRDLLTLLLDFFESALGLDLPLGFLAYLASTFTGDCERDLDRPVSF